MKAVSGPAASSGDSSCLLSPFRRDDSGGSSCGKQLSLLFSCSWLPALTVLTSKIWPRPGEVAGSGVQSSAAPLSFPMLRPPWRAGPCAPSQGPFPSPPFLHLPSSPDVAPPFPHCLGEKCENAHERTSEVCEGVAEVGGSVKGFIRTYWV